MRVLITGSQGQVGQELVQVLAGAHHITALARHDLELTDFDRIRSVVSHLSPDVIINAAAYTAVDKAESEPQLAHQVNALVPGQLALAAEACGASIIHLSTDYVFDGRQNRPYKPDASTCPVGTYGKSKQAGEVAIQRATKRHVLLRTAWVYGAKGKGNFVKTMLRLGAEREELRVVYDQVGSPTWAHDIAQAIAALLPKLHSDTFGTYHYTNSGAVSWYDFAVAIFEEARAHNYPLQVSRILPITSDQYPTPAERPAYSVLAGDKLAALIGRTAPHWRTSLRKMLKETLYDHVG